MSRSSWTVGVDKAAVGAAVALRVAALSEAAIAERGRFVVALSGGSLPKIVAAGLAAADVTVDYANWRVIFADERCVALDDDDR